MIWHSVTAPEKRMKAKANQKRPKHSETNTDIFETCNRLVQPVHKKKIIFNNSYNDGKHKTLRITL